MDEGLIQILVIAFFIIISMMDAAKRKKRQESERRHGMGQPDGSAETGASSAGSVDTGDVVSTRAETTSEGMVPEDLWEEIAALAGGGPRPSRRRLPSTRLPEAAGTSGQMSVPDVEESSLSPAHQHVDRHEHVEWSDYGEWDLEPARDPAREAPVRPEALPPATAGDEPARRATPRPHGKGEAVRRALALGGRGNIREAVILSEVLGLPTALRPSHHEPPG